MAEGAKLRITRTPGQTPVPILLFRLSPGPCHLEQPVPLLWGKDTQLISGGVPGGGAGSELRQPSAVGAGLKPAPTPSL